MDKNTSKVIDLDTSGLARTIDDVKRKFKKLFKTLPKFDRSFVVGDAVATVWEKIYSLASIKQKDLDQLVLATAQTQNEIASREQSTATENQSLTDELSDRSKSKLELPPFMNELDAAHCDALRMKMIEGKRLVDIAQALHVSVSTAGRMVRKAAKVYYDGQADE